MFLMPSFSSTALWSASSMSQFLVPFFFSLRETLLLACCLWKITSAMLALGGILDLKGSESVGKWMKFFLIWAVCSIGDVRLGWRGDGEIFISTMLPHNGKEKWRRRTQGTSLPTSQALGFQWLRFTRLTLMDFGWGREGRVDISCDRVRIV